MRARAELDHRLGDADRRAALEALGTHHEAGRLSSEEVEDRQLTVANAQTWSDVVPLFADLPTPHPAGMPRPARGGAAGRTGGGGLTPVQRNAAIGLVTMG